MSRVTLLRSVRAPHRAPRTLCLLGLLGILVLGCRDRLDRKPFDASTHCRDRPVQMAIASSLHELAISLRHQLRTLPEPIEITPIYGASSAHARQLLLVAPMDLIVAADAEIIDDLVRRGLIVDGSQLEFAGGQLALVAHPRWPILGSAQSALEAATLERIAIPSASVPLGRYARAWLASRGLLESLRGRIVVMEHARATLSAVDSGLVDLALVYRSELRLVRRAATVELIDPAEHPPIRYIAARTSRAPACPSIDSALAAWGDTALQQEMANSGFLVARHNRNRS